MHVADSAMAETMRATRATMTSVSLPLMAIMSSRSGCRRRLPGGSCSSSTSLSRQLLVVFQARGPSPTSAPRPRVGAPMRQASARQLQGLAETGGRVSVPSRPVGSGMSPAGRFSRWLERLVAPTATGCCWMLLEPECPWLYGAVDGHRYTMPSLVIPHMMLDSYKQNVWFTSRGSPILLTLQPLLDKSCQLGTNITMDTFYASSSVDSKSIPSSVLLVQGPRLK